MSGELDEIDSDVKADISVKETIIVFGGNGFIGSRLCRQLIIQGYDVISISRTGECPIQYKSEIWANKVQWFKGNALDKNSFIKYIKSNKPYCVCSMIGTLNIRLQGTKSVKWIYNKYAGKPNINVMEVCKQNNVNKFIYISANLMNWTKKLKKYNDKSFFGLWSLMYGQYKSKLECELTVNKLFAKNGISFRPGIVNGKRYFVDLNFFGWYDIFYKMNRCWLECIFGTKYETLGFNMLPLYSKLKRIYKFIDKDCIDANEIANDVVTFIGYDTDSNDIKDIELECLNSIHGNPIEI